MSNLYLRNKNNLLGAPAMNFIPNLTIKSFKTAQNFVKNCRQQQPNISNPSFFIIFYYIQVSASMRKAFKRVPNSQVESDFCRCLSIIFHVSLSEIFKWIFREFEKFEICIFLDIQVNCEGFFIDFTTLSNVI